MRKLPLVVISMIDLNTWNLTIPEQVPARTIETRLVKADYRSPYFQRSGQTLIFWAPVTGTSTANSPYPRTELRETFADGKLRNWLYKEGSHHLSASLAVTQVPSSGKVVIGQVHSKDNPTPFIKLQYQFERGVGYVNLELRRKPGDIKSPVVMTYRSMPLDTRFNYAIDISRNGDLRVTIDGLTYTDRIDPAWADKRFYFKAGVYTLDNQGPSSEGGRAVFHQLRATHGK
ncbi:polysaccharide lyase family 7 protein [Ectopseudomonas guguanensis]|uniref:Alginate lyase n=2 Tax=Ectopseudomonas guguanensis TaxID=1198456 RepID=A0A1H0WND2_9GAMM|nr:MULTISPECIES: polysaccharide lyase family 7 protein [Pseudomonas]MPT17771.1 polysaccharide lyase family 7 protein [Pseudomonas sp.]WJH57988.1 polysaccharide lyase family 7 protein [Pseudomonas guguanensis]SDP91776.1 Alginate lyase [Pseudomonas guguanensis]